MIRREVRLFGGLRRFGDSVLVETPETTDAAGLKAAVIAVLSAFPDANGRERLVEVSALADEREVLEDHARPAPDARLALLPPVCGG